MLIPQDLKKSLEKFRGFYLIVEGKKDEKALKKLGFDRVLVIGGKSLDNFVDTLPYNEQFVILTDFDEEGERKNKKLTTLLQKSKRKVNSRLRVFFKNLFLVNKIEEVKKFFEVGVYGEISTINDKILNRSRFHRRWRGRETRCYWGNLRAD